MSKIEVLLDNVTFAYETGDDPLMKDATLHFTRGWTGVVGANGAGKTTLMKLAIGELNPIEGHVSLVDDAIYCEQRTDDPPEMLAELIDDADSEAFEIRGRLGIERDWLKRWPTLSHGERKRAQVGVVLWRQPQVLAIDEPTNHLDSQARELLASALARFRGVGLLVSHDRQLLDDLCHQCVFVDPPDVVTRPGGVTAGQEQARLEAETSVRKREQAKRERQRLEREATARRQEAARADKRRSKGGLGKGDNDERFKRNLARVTGRDAVSGKLLRQMDGRLAQARDREAQIVVRKTYDLGIWVAGERSKRDTLLRLEGGSLPLGAERQLHYPDLAMKPDERIALTGANGGGKSTLVRHLMKSLNVPDERVTYVPQEIDAGDSRRILDEARGLPKEELGRLMTVVSCLGSRPGRLLRSEQPSPGEVRKLLLASGIARVPHLIVMDEPTNHLDLPSIECLEEALETCPCGLLLVSHDERFLRRLTKTRWHIESAARGTELSVAYWGDSLADGVT